MSPKKTLQLFEQLGITPKIEGEGKTYPLSEQASSIVDVLIYEIERLHIPVKYEAFVTSIKKTTIFDLELQSGEHLQADRIILATGGLAMPKSGSDGTGYQLAQSLGHTITPVFPALVKLELSSPHLKALDGVKFPGTVELIHDGAVVQTETGDILFTKYGISGPTILQISRKANQLLQDGHEVWINVIVVNGPEKRDVAKRFAQLKDRTIEMSLIGLINKRIIHPILKEAHIDPHILVKDLSKDKMNQLMQLLFGWEFPVVGSKDFDDAQVTAGGISIDEVNPQTLESKKISHLYFCGEILDIDGLCGGYNLQWAWSSGFIAGKYAGR